MSILKLAINVFGLSGSKMRYRGAVVTMCNDKIMFGNSKQQ